MKWFAGILMLVVTSLPLMSAVSVADDGSTYNDTKTYWCPSVQDVGSCDLEVFGESSNLFRALEEKVLGKCKTAMDLTKLTHKISANGTLDCRYRLNGKGPILTYRQNASVKGCKLDEGWLKKGDGYECPGILNQYCRAVCK
jgi:hypothetical protein